MAKPFLTIDEVCAELQLSKEQVMALVKKGDVRAFLDQGAYKFRREDVDKARKLVEGNRTVVQETPQKGKSDGSEISKSDTSKIDLADIDTEPGTDESDQTSVLAPPDEGETIGEKEETPAFAFSEEDLGLSIEDQATQDVTAASDQTSLLSPAGAVEAEAEEEPAFEFADTEEDLVLDADAGDSILVADESESSLDILEVAEESSSESESSASKVKLDDGSSSEEVLAIAEDSEESSEEPVSKAAAAAGTSDTVVDILGDAEEGTDDALETIDLEEVVDTQENPVEDAVESGEDIPVIETAEVSPVSDEPETVGVAPDDATHFSEAEEEVSSLAELPPEALEAGVEGEAEEAPQQAGMVAAGWTLVVPSVVGNTCLFLAILLAGFGGFLLLSEVAGIRNVVTDETVKLVNELLKLIG